MRYAAALGLALLGVISCVCCERVEEPPAETVDRNAGYPVKCGTTTTFCVNPLYETVIVEVTASDYCPTGDSVILHNATTEYLVADMSTITIPIKLKMGDYLEFSAEGDQTEDWHYCSVKARVIKIVTP
ncbi:MAG: hypothetical protein JSW52_01150 [Candidatus Coatesbacteria bacterium]|nr:MAG: hypothetical protein JSW52_01150 [Candidatus Coatesbacteria bacterium]